jgi:hypothetical protein
VTVGTIPKAASGTTWGNSLLTDNGSVVTASSGYISSPYFYSSNYNNGLLYFDNTGANYGNISNPQTDVWSLGYSADKTTAGTSVLSWTGGGLIGIGTKIPTDNLTIYATTPSISLQESGFSHNYTSTVYSRPNGFGSVSPYSSSAGGIVFTGINNNAALPGLTFFGANDNTGALTGAPVNFTSFKRVGGITTALGATDPAFTFSNGDVFWTPGATLLSIRGDGSVTIPNLTAGGVVKATTGTGSLNAAALTAAEIPDSLYERSITISNPGTLIPLTVIQSGNVNSTSARFENTNTSAGSVGIGLLTNESDANGTVTRAAILANRSADNCGSLRLQTRSNGSVATKVTVDSAGNTGFGITDPTAKIHTYKGTGSGTHTILMEGHGTTNATLALDFNNSISGLGGEIGVYKGAMTLRTGTYGSLHDVLFLDSTGKAGIGTAAPTCLAQVKGPCRVGALRVDTTTTAPSTGALALPGSVYGGTTVLLGVPAKWVPVYDSVGTLLGKMPLY